MLKLVLSLLVLILAIAGGLWVYSQWREPTEPLYVTVVYPATPGARDFMDDALIGEGERTRQWECVGGGTSFGEDKMPMSDTAVIVALPYRQNLAALLAFLRALPAPKGTVVQTQHGRIKL